MHSRLLANNQPLGYNAYHWNPATRLTVGGWRALSVWNLMLVVLMNGCWVGGRHSTSNAAYSLQSAVTQSQNMSTAAFRQFSLSPQ